MLKSILRQTKSNLINYVKCSKMELNNSVTMEEGRKFSYAEIARILDKMCPSELAESWDNTGLLIEPSCSQKTIDSIFLTNDLTEPVLDEAIAMGMKFIISYHPALFVPFKTVVQNDWKQRIITKCLENKIAVYSPHTRFDAMRHGVNDWLALAFENFDKQLAPNIVQPIRPNETNPEIGEGRICTLSAPKEIKDIVPLIKGYLNLEHIQLALGHHRNYDSSIKTIAICAGSGAPLLKTCDADLYLTGEMKHHDLLDAVHRGVTVILCGHCNSERGFLTIFAGFFKKLCPNLEVFVSQTDSSPFQIV